MRNQTVSLVAKMLATFLVCTSVIAETIVVPVGVANSEVAFGSGSLVNVSHRSQQVYAASQFSGATGALVITELRFRPDAFFGKAFTTTVANVRISLSTTKAGENNLSSQYAQNIGADESVVFFGALPVSSAFSLDTNGTRAFDIVVPVVPAFVYAPSRGNLLLEIRNDSGSTASYLSGQGINGDGGSRVIGNAGSSSGFADTGIDALMVVYQPTNAPPAPPPAIIRGPYLQSGSAQGMTVRWRTDLPSDSFVRFGLSPENLDSQIVNSVITTEHVIEIEGLSAGTKFFYVIGSGTNVLAGGNDHYFVTSPETGKRTRIWAIGDSGTASVGSQAPLLIRNAYTSIAGTNHTDVWLMLGDNAYYSGTDSEYQAAVFNVFQDLLRTTPLWPTIGNHETYAPGSGGSLAYFDIFSLPQNGQAGGVPSGTERYYSFDHGAIHFVCLDSELSDPSVGGPMLTWLDQDLAANTKDWTIVYWHSPPYSRGSHNSDFEGNLMQMRESVVPMLESYGVDLVLCGHSHSYERSYLLKGHYGLSSSLTPSMILDGGSGQTEGTGAYSKPPSGQGEGTIYVVAGSAGQTSGGSLNHPAMFVSLNRLGSMVIDVESNRLDASFLRENGTVDDHFTIIKAPMPPAITSQPASRNAYVGGTASFSVSASGTPPLTYQWWFGGNELSGETNATLALANVQLNQAGLYSVRVTNDFGSVVSVEATLTVNVAPACVPPPAGIVAWWPFDGDAQDLVGTNHGILRGGASFGAGRVGQGLLLDGLDDYVLVPDSPSLRLTNELTVEMWFKSTSGNWGGLIDKRGGGRANYGLFISPGDRVQLYYDQGGGFLISYSPLPSLNEFHHIAGTYRQVSPNEIELKTYLDGQLVRTDLLPGNLANTVNNTAVAIGGVSGSCCFFTGVIDDVTVYGRALSAAEIHAIYDGAVAGKCNQIPPQILTQPGNATVLVGRTAGFSVSANGTAPLRYQWLFEGNVLAGETNATLDLVNVQLNQAGVYAVQVTNDFGSVLSADATLTVNAAPACVPPPAGIVAWWPFDGNAQDLVGTNHGILRGGASFGAGRVGQGLLLDGLDDYVLVPDSPSLRLTSELTVEMWFKSTSGNWGGLIDKRGGGRVNYGLFISPGDRVQLYYDQGGGFLISYSPLPSLNEFHHIAGTYRQVSPNEIELKTYLDGQLVRTDVLPGNLANTVNNTAVAIGGVSGSCCFFTGVIDDVTVYGRALSAAEIHAIYVAAGGGKCVAPAAPVIVAQPRSQTVTRGSVVNFDVAAVGTLPLAYQWFHDDLPVTGASNATLVLPDVQYSQSGDYTVTISNAAGQVTSEIAALAVRPPPSVLRVVEGSASSGGPAGVSIELLAQGFENAVGFSLEFDGSLLRLLGVSLGAGLPDGSALLVNTNVAGSGKLGIAVALPADVTVPAGTQQVVQVQFEISAVFAQASTPIAFGDQPTLRQISDAMALPLLAEYLPGSLAISAVALEGDVALRPAGDMNLSIIDWVQAGRFAAGLDTVAPNEFQRADCAPRDARGNGIISIADWVQTGRYAAGLDPRTTAGGPSAPDSPAPLGARSEFEAAGGRALTLATTNVLPGGSVAVPVFVDAQGNENAVGFSVAFDAARLRFVGALKLAKVASATLNVNTNESGSGNLGVALALPTGASIAAGADPLLLMTFAAVSNATGSAALVLGNQPIRREIADVAASSLNCSYINGSIAFGPPTPEGPALSARRTGGNVRLFWPSNPQGFELYSSPGVSGSAWTKVQVTPIDIGGQLIATLPATNTQQYFRLMKP